MPRRTTKRHRDWGTGTLIERPARNGTVHYRARRMAPDATGQMRRHSKTFSTRDAAETFLRGVGGHRSPADMTVTDLPAETLNRAKGRLSERTVRTYLDRARTMILPHLGG